MKFELDLERGKYMVDYDHGKIKVLRYGVKWRDETGDGFIHALLMRITDLEQCVNPGCQACKENNK